ncbi:MAG: hypothetical protein IIV88_03470, partial [Erysipelotrichaceae bacterium]|nr:hypothetical protein [Erysipelotrichaceae bacterium]
MKNNKNRRSLRMIFSLLLAGILLTVFSGCGSRPPAAEAAEAFLKQLQEEPAKLVSLCFADPEDPMRKLVEEMIGEFEYTVTGEKEETTSPSGQKEKTVTVDFKGYDIGGYIGTYTKNHTTERLNWLAENGYSLTNLRTLSDEKAAELNREADAAYFAELMEECRSTGKTRTAAADLTFFWSKAEKSWIPTQQSVCDVLDAASGYLYSIMREAAENGAGEFAFPGNSLPDFDGCIILIHLGEDHYAVGYELHNNGAVVFGERGEWAPDRSTNPVLDLLSSEKIGQKGKFEYEVPQDQTSRPDRSTVPRSSGRLPPMNSAKQTCRSFGKRSRPLRSHGYSKTPR